MTHTLITQRRSSLLVQGPFRADILAVCTIIFALSVDFCIDRVRPFFSRNRAHPFLNEYPHHNYFLLLRPTRLSSASSHTQPSYYIHTQKIKMRSILRSTYLNSHVSRNFSRVQSNLRLHPTMLIQAQSARLSRGRNIKLSNRHLVHSNQPVTLIN